jgi:hypothetical protein
MTSPFVESETLCIINPAPHVAHRASIMTGESAKELRARFELWPFGSHHPPFAIAPLSIVLPVDSRFRQHT